MIRITPQSSFYPHENVGYHPVRWEVWVEYG